MARDKKSMIGFDPLAWLDKDADTKEKTGADKAAGVHSNEKSKSRKKTGAKVAAGNKVNMIDVLGHSIDETALLKGYALASEVLDDVVEDFYSELFSQYPEVKSLFENTSDKSQASKLSAALNLLVDNLHNESALNSTLEEMGKRHQKYGALPEHYPIVAELLVASFKNEIGRSWTKAINAAWLSLLGAVAETMYSVYTDDDSVSANEQIAQGEGQSVEESAAHEPLHNEVDNMSNKPVIQLKSVQDISKSQLLKNDLMLLINDNDEIDIDGSLVERIDGTALQLMCALFVYAKQNNLIIHWVSPSEALIKSAEVLGVNKLLELS